MAENVKVALRIRPFSERETEVSSKCVLDVADNQVCVTKPFSFYKHGMREKNLVKIEVAKTFSFDNIFWSLDENDSRFSDQSNVYASLGPPLVEDVFAGFNCCIFAYGQTGSGKTYTMLGRNAKEDEGIIPRLCHDLFERVKLHSAQGEPESSVKVVVSYMEIYNEKVFDLLDPKSKQNLKVREHPILGPYVDGLKQLAVSSYEDVEQLLISGSRQRTVAATSMNIESSRSHAIFMLKITQTSVDSGTGITGEKVSKVSLVDLAGSERASKSGAVGDRLKEGSNINKSLTTLGLVIAALADQSNTATPAALKQQQQQQQHIPYRDSVLTWLLRDCLGGNTRTVLVATLSPAEDNLGETISTLRYADRAKRIVNRAVVNEDPTARIIRELREEVDTLRNQLARSSTPPLSQAMAAPSTPISNMSSSTTVLATPTTATTTTTGSASGSSTDLSLIDRLDASERLMTEMSRTWEDRLEESDRLRSERHQELERLGLRIESGGIRLSMKSMKNSRCFLVNLNADPSLNEMLVYYLNQPGETLVCKGAGGDYSSNEDETTTTSSSSHPLAVIRLNGIGILNEHAVFSVNASGLVKIRPFLNAYTLINDNLLTSEVALKHGDNLQFGTSTGTLFRLNCPLPTVSTTTTARKEQKQHTTESASLKLDSNDGITDNGSSSDGANGNNATSKDMADVTVAAIEKQYELLSAKNNADILSTSTSRDSLDSPAESTHASTGSLAAAASTTAVAPTTTASNNNSSVGVSTVTGRVSKHQQQLMIKTRLDEDRRRRQDRLKADLANLRRQLIRTNTMVYEANLMANQYKVPVSFSPTLQIPPSMLEVTPASLAGSRRSLLSEPAVLATSQRGTGCQRTLSLSEFESVLMACRDSMADAPTSSSSSQYDDGLNSGSDNNGANQSSSSSITATAGWQLASVIDESSPTGGLQLVGVANIYLSALFYTIPYTYSAPIISTLGETCGTITVCLARRPDHHSVNDLNSSSTDSLLSSSLALPFDQQSDSSSSQQQFNDFNTLSYYSTSRGLRVGDHAVVRVGIVAVNGLDVRSVAMCRYTFWDSPVTTSVQPVLFRTLEDNSAQLTRFDDAKTFRVRVTDEFIDYCAEGALAIQVWSYPALSEQEAIQSAVAPSLPTAEDHRRAIFNRLLERWAEVTGRLDVSVEVHELKEDGSSYAAVPVDLKDPENHSGGVFKLTHGRSRRLVVHVQPLPSDKGAHLPLQVDSIQAVQFGGVFVRNSVSSPLDSYQQIDLDILMTKWRDALESRTKYLDEQLRAINSNRSMLQQQQSSSSSSSSGEVMSPTSSTSSPTGVDARREATIFQEWSLLVAEKELSEEPEPGCGLPGAEPAEDDGHDELNYQNGRESHRPVIFLDLPVESLTTGYPISRQNLAGANGFLDKEVHAKFVELPVIKEIDAPIGAITNWDPVAANWLIFDKPTLLDDKIYAILRLVIRLSHPTQIDIMLRKRMCFSIASAPPAASGASKFFSLKNRLFSSSNSNSNNARNRSDTPDGCHQTSVVYDLISNLPLASYDVARRSVLAKMAADPSGTAVNTAAIEKYVQAVQAVESLMVMDRLRQQLALQKCVDVALGRTGVSHDLSGLQRALLSPHDSLTNSPSAPSNNNNNNRSHHNNSRIDANGSNNSVGRRTGSGSNNLLMTMALPPPLAPMQAPITPVVVNMNSLAAVQIINSSSSSSPSSLRNNNSDNKNNISIKAGDQVDEVELAFPTSSN